MPGLVFIGTWAATCIVLGFLVVRRASRLETLIDNRIAKSNKRFDVNLAKSDRRVDDWIAEAVHDRRVAQSRMDAFRGEMRRLERWRSGPERRHGSHGGPRTSEAV